MPGYYLHIIYLAHYIILYLYIWRLSWFSHILEIQYGKIVNLTDNAQKHCYFALKNQLK